MRRGTRLPLDVLEPFLLDDAPVGRIANPSCAIDWCTLFGNDHAVEIEVGSGKGLFLVTSAQARPATNFLGIEIQRKYALYAADRLAKRDLCNARVACADAKVLLAARVVDESVQAVHIYFPDPWWKKRHHKRRLLTPAFIKVCTRVLHPSGRLTLVTDVAEYHQAATSLLDQEAGLRPRSAPHPAEPEHDLDYLTNFERKYRKEGRPIFRSQYEKRAASPF